MCVSVWCQQLPQISCVVDRQQLVMHARHVENKGS
jgi:hypothetical protein